MSKYAVINPATGETVKEYPLNAYDADATPNYECWAGLQALPRFRVASTILRLISRSRSRGSSRDRSVRRAPFPS